MHHLMLGTQAKGSEIQGGHRIGCDDMQNFSGPDLGEFNLSFQQRQWASKTRCIKIRGNRNLVDIDDFVHPNTRILSRWLTLTPVGILSSLAMERANQPAD